MTGDLLGAVIADTHADETVRWDEHGRVMDWIADDLDRRGVALAMHAGDIYEARSTPRERTYVHGWCQRVCEGRPLVICGGNHEEPEDVEALARLRTKYPIVASERPMVTVQAGAAIALLPWPRKAHLLAALGTAVDTATSDRVATDMLRNIIRGLGVQIKEHAGPRVLLAHALIDGCYTDHDQPLIGQAMALSVMDLALAQADVNAVGHIHAASVRNEWTHPVPTAYPGAPRHNNWGEAGPGKGYMLLRWEGGRFMGWERVLTPCRPMLLIKGRYHAGAIRWEAPPIEVMRGAEVRLRYTVAAHERAAAAHEERAIKGALIAMGAVEAKLEADTVTTAVARAPEVARADSTESALLARWDLRREHEEPAERAELLGMYSELEEAAA